MSEDDGDFERFCEDAYPRLVAALAHHCGDLNLAEDCAQEALVRARQRWAHVSEYQAPVGWCFHVGANLARSWFRRRQAERRALTRLADGASAPSEPDTTDRLAVRNAVATLNPRQREAVVLQYFLGLSAGETAAVTGSTAGAVRVLTHRAVAALREQFATASPRTP